MASKFEPDPFGLSPGETNYLQTARRRIQDTYGIGIAQNAQQRSQLRNQLSRSKADLTRRFGAERRKLPSSYAKGNVLNSGLYQKALADLASDRTRAFSNLSGEFGDQMSQLQLARQQLERTRQSSLVDIDSQEAARRAALAASLRSVSSTYGGLF